MARVAEVLFNLSLLEENSRKMVDSLRIFSRNTMIVISFNNLKYKLLSKSNFFEVIKCRLVISFLAISKIMIFCFWHVTMINTRSQK